MTRDIYYPLEIWSSYFKYCHLQNLGAVILSSKYEICLLVPVVARETISVQNLIFPCLCLCV